MKANESQSHGGQAMGRPGRRAVSGGCAAERLVETASAELENLQIEIKVD
jgi:hypothetical protein